MKNPKNLPLCQQIILVCKTYCLCQQHTENNSPKDHQFIRAFTCTYNIHVHVHILETYYFILPVLPPPYPHYKENRNYATQAGGSVGYNAHDWNGFPVLQPGNVSSLICPPHVFALCFDPFGILECGRRRSDHVCKRAPLSGR